MMKLPEGYKEIKRINLQKDKKKAIYLNIAGLILMLVLYFIGNVIYPTSNNNYKIIFPILFFYLLYIIGHELVHGIFMKLYSGVKPKYGFTLLYAYAGSDAFFNKKQYITISLAPVIICGIIFLILNISLPLKWFWIIYMLQILNLSGAVGDIYMTLLMTKLPEDVLINDSGIEIDIFSKI